MSEEEFKATGRCCRSYTVYEIELSDCGTMARYREQTGVDEYSSPSEWLEIKQVEETECEESGHDIYGCDCELIDVIEPNGINIPLNIVMRVNR
jgi:hypothetical protein